jgi:hypothetical protein
MSEADEPEALTADEAARLIRRRDRKRGLRQYRTIFLVSSYWTIATLGLALTGSVLHIFEIRDACADILGVDGPVRASTALRPPGMVVVCHTAGNPARSVEIPVATTALVILWSTLGILTAIALLFGYRHIRKQIARGHIDL